MNFSIAVVVILFTLSLVAAWILFKILQSTASINKKEYQMGGAAAGFLIIYAVLNASYSNIAKTQAEDAKTQLQACLAEEEEVPVKGTVAPALANAEVVYATKSVSLPDDGVFHFSARKKDIKSNDPPTIYVTTEQKQYHLQIDPDENVSNLKFSIPKGEVEH